MLPRAAGVYGILSNFCGKMEQPGVNRLHYIIMSGMGAIILFMAGWVVQLTNNVNTKISVDLEELKAAAIERKVNDNIQEKRLERIEGELKDLKEHIRKLY